MSERKKSRRERREDERRLGKLARDKERLFLLEAGGSSERPIELESASQVEVHARAARCPHCELPLHLVEHAAPPGHVGLRAAHLRCPSCGVTRTLFYRLRSAAPS